jgi:hypothetical protein
MLSKLLISPTPIINYYGYVLYFILLVLYWYGVNGTFFDVLHTPTITAKQLKLRDPSGGLASMSKLISF